MARQINVFMDNKPGRLNAVTGLLASHHVNILFFAIQDSGDFGMLKLLVNQTDLACKALKEAGYAAAVKDIVLIRAKDKPGNLCTISQIFEKQKINLKDARGFAQGGTGACCFEVDDVASASSELQKAGFELIDETQL